MKNRNKYYLNLYYETKKRMIAYLGGVCVECGTVENLEIHHKDRKLKAFNPSNGWGRPWDQLVVELDKCELLCSKHHKKVHEAAHGTVSRYNNSGCRCDPCRLAWNLACRKWSADSRKRTKDSKGIVGDGRSSTMWITDGAKNSKIQKGSSIPEGWRQGRFV